MVGSPVMGGPQGNPGEERVVPTALVGAWGTISEVYDGRGRRLLEAEPDLVAYARALLDSELPLVRFTWITSERTWYAVTVQRQPAGAAPGSAATVELVELDPPGRLTVRELDVLTLVAGGLSNPEIAVHLGTTSRTISSHVESILAKLGQATRAGAAGLAIEHGLLRAPVPGGGRSIGALAIGVVDQLATGGAERARVAQPAPARTRTRPRPYLIGAAFPLGGRAAAEGVEMRRGSQLAIADVNARGGIAGRPVERLLVEVDPFTREGVETAFRRLVDAEVDAIVTGYAFVEDVTLYDVVAPYGCPLLNVMTSETQAEWVREDPSRLGQVFQVGPTENHYGVGFVRFLDELVAAGRWKPPNRRLVFIETPVAGGEIARPLTIRYAERAGWKPDARIAVAAHDADWTEALAEIRRSAPAAVLAAHFVPAELARFQRQFVADPTDTLIYALYAPSVPEYLELAGPAAEGVVWATLSGVYSDRLGAAFRARYTAAHGMAPGRSLAGISYDQVNLLVHAWAHVGNPRAFGEVASALRQLTHRGVNGTYFLGDDRQCALAYPDQTPDPSMGLAHLVFQVQHGTQRVLAPAPYAEATFTTPPWYSGAGRRAA